MSSEPFYRPMPEHHTNTRPRTEEQYWVRLLLTRVRFSTCGSFCFLAHLDEFLVLKSSLLEEKTAKTQTPAVWEYHTSYNQRAYGVEWRGNSTTVRLYQALDYVDRSRLRDSMEYPISVSITVLPAYLASGEIYLLVGKSGDDLTRMLVLPRKGRPEIKNLRVTLNQILDELARRPLPAITEKDASDTGSAEADEDELRLSEKESSDTRSEVAEISADDDKPGVLDSEKSSDTSSEVASMSADKD